MPIRRANGRRPLELRPVTIRRGCIRAAPGSVLIRMGGTAVICSATIEETVPEWMRGQGRGWVTAEYDMLPGSTGRRRPRNRLRVDGRVTEIQRLIGRALRSVVELDRLGERTIWIDCDVLEADGGTRTAAITGACVALADALRTLPPGSPDPRSCLCEAVAAVSVGLVDGQVLLDLDYAEDSRADADLNIAMTASGRFVEIQGCAEGTPFSRADLDRMLEAASRGIRQLLSVQARALAGRSRPTRCPR